MEEDAKSTSTYTVMINAAYLICLICLASNCLFAIHPPCDSARTIIRKTTLDQILGDFGSQSHSVLHETT